MKRFDIHKILESGVPILDSAADYFTPIIYTVIKQPISLQQQNQTHS